jgi:hypothetical protein
MRKDDKTPIIVIERGRSSRDSSAMRSDEISPRVVLEYCTRFRSSSLRLLGHLQQNKYTYTFPPCHSPHFPATPISRSCFHLSQCSSVTLAKKHDTPCSISSQFHLVRHEHNSENGNVSVTQRRRSEKTTGRCTSSRCLKRLPFVDQFPRKACKPEPLWRAGRITSSWTSVSGERVCTLYSFTRPSRSLIYCSLAGSM